MKNKIELKKMLAISLVVIILGVILLAVLNYYQYKTYTNNFNNKLNEIMIKVKEEYPNVGKEEIIEIINGNSTSSDNQLLEYGIDLRKDTVILENDDVYFKFSFINTVVLVIFILALETIFLKYNKRKDDELQNITEYINEINNRNYKLNINENSEDELSILKNELYKITVTLKEQAENSLKDKENLKDSLSDISHQLKTPITSMVILLDNIIDNPNMDEETKMEFVKDIRRKVQNINFLVQSILKISKFDANTIKFDDREVKLINIINEAKNNLSVLSDLKNVEVNVTCNKDIFINCDFKWQVEAITNLLKNAIEYSMEGAKIEINVEDNKLFTTVVIRDYGKGMNEKDLKHVFERFYKGENSSKDSIGIGLALSKMIIEKDNGSISVESKIDKGTMFIIRYFK